MRRVTSQPRPNWRARVESQGFHFHTPGNEPYWDESVYYLFTAAQIDEIERATYALNDTCLAAVEHVLAHNLLHLFDIPAAFEAFIRESWERDEFTLYGRFDLAYDGVSPPKMLEYNADTPTSLLEAAVIQWFWKQEVHPRLDQFNSIHERLLEGWKLVAPALAQDGIHFTSISGNLEDFMTTSYLRDTAMQAGLDTHYLEVEQIGFDRARGQFVDDRDRSILNCFKLYPWEWMIREPFAPMLAQSDTYWLESPWKMLLSNKAILPILWQLFPDSPYLLSASFEPINGPHVKKPLLGREGANVTIIANDRTIAQTDGPYGGRSIYQQFHSLPSFDGHHPLVGSWMINGHAAGIGIREDRSLVTGNTSRFVPHVFEP